MFSIVRRQALTALSLVALLLFGAAAAEARSTHGSDRLVKGAAVGAAVGAVTQAVRGRTAGRELLKGAALGGLIGAGVGAYSDYKQEKSARESAERRADYYQYTRGGYRDGYRANRTYRARRGGYQPAYYNAPAYYQYQEPVYYQGNGKARGHRGGKHRCR
ncbi:MAG TPA: hypothetical protein VGX68_00960 [Thermoanaerobaculia bacterium]|jgi:hypothetical protein|nr:hypothetical protein [Thermoanaerobaculia bacterium]